MSSKRLFILGVLATAVGIAAYRTAVAQERKPDRAPPPKGAGEFAPAEDEDWQPPGRGGPRGDRPPPRRDDFNRLPPPDREGRLDKEPRRPRRPPGDGDFDQPPLGPPEGGPGLDGPRPGGGGPGGPRGPYPDWASLERNDPEMFRLVQSENSLERQTMQLVRQYRQGSGPKNDDLKKQVEKLVDQQFEVRQQRRELELKRMEEELKRLRDAIARRNQARKQIVEKRVTELLGHEEDIGF